MPPNTGVDEDKRSTLRRFAALGVAATPVVTFSSDSRAETDNNDVRNAIVGYLSLTPGAHFSKIRDDLQLGTGETQHHLGELSNQGMIERYRDGDYKRYVPANRYDDFEKLVLGYLRRETPRGMIVELLRDPSITTTELATELEVSTPTISKYAGELEAVGLLSRENGYRVERPETVVLLIVAHANSLDNRSKQFAIHADSLLKYTR